MGEMEAFAAALRRLRVERGMSLRGLAALAPLDVGYLSKIENGHRKVTLSVARAVDASRVRSRSQNATRRWTPKESSSPWPGSNALPAFARRYRLTL